MSDDNFPARLVRLTEDGTPGEEIQGAVAQVDLSELADKLAPILDNQGDSTFTSSSLDDARPDAASPTKGPHRYTIYVPHNDFTRVNFGAPGPVLGETGISAETKTHIHLYSWGAPFTYLSLGAAPVNTGLAVNKQTAGYSLFTAGAWNSSVTHDVSLASNEGAMNLLASKNVRVSSATAGVQIEAKNHLTVSGHGNVEISAGPDAAVAEPSWGTWLGAAALTVVDGADFLAPAAGFKGGATEAGAGAVTGAGSFFAGLADGDASKLRDQWVAKYSGGIDKVLGHLATTAGLVLGFKKQWKKPKHGRATWEDGFGWVSWIVSMGAEINAIIGDLGASKENEAGDVKINAKANVSVSADASVSISGAKGVSISGFKGASMSGLTAGLKGHKEGTVWGGLGASLKALAGDAVVSSDLKGASVKAKKDVEMSSEAAKATVTGKQDAQLNSTDGKAFVHGKTGALVASGDYGVVARPDFVEMGKLKSADKFGDARADDIYVAFSDQGVDMQTTSSNQLHLNKSGIVVIAKKLEVKSDSTVEIKGKVINLN